MRHVPLFPHNVTVLDLEVAIDTLKQATHSNHPHLVRQLSALNQISTQVISLCVIISSSPDVERCERRSTTRTTAIVSPVSSVAFAVAFNFFCVS